MRRRSRNGALARSRLNVSSGPEPPPSQTSSEN
jgi:hypothetical protein